MEMELAGPVGKSIEEPAQLLAPGKRDREEEEEEERDEEEEEDEDEDEDEEQAPRTLTYTPAGSESSKSAMTAPTPGPNSASKSKENQDAAIVNKVIANISRYLKGKVELALYIEQQLMHGETEKQRKREEAKQTGNFHDKLVFCKDITTEYLKGQLSISTSNAISEEHWEEERKKAIPIEADEVTALFQFQHGLQKDTLLPHVNQATSAHAFVSRRNNLCPRIVADDVAKMGLKVMAQFDNNYGYYKYPANDNIMHQRCVMAIA